MTLHFKVTRSIEQIFSMPGDIVVVLAGDFNKLPSDFLTSQGLLVQFDGPTHQGNCLDKIYASENIYDVCIALDSTVITKHKAIIARVSGQINYNPKKIKSIKQIRSQPPSQHARILNKNANARTSHCMQKGGLGAG